jgi:hypothetical protein
VFAELSAGRVGQDCNSYLRAVHIGLCCLFRGHSQRLHLLHDNLHDSLLPSDRDNNLLNHLPLGPIHSRGNSALLPAVCFQLHNLLSSSFQLYFLQLFGKLLLPEQLLPLLMS